LVGTTVQGRYHLVRLLGDGGMGSVYKAADQVLRRFVAVKLLHPNTAENPSAVERFIREARAAASIGHPNIIDILDFGTEKARPFLVMEYLRGRSLSQAIHHEGAFSVQRACSIATHSLAGLAGAHDRGILHRDLKPANLMLIHKFGDRDFVKVCDFGFATLLTPSVRIDDAKSLTPARTLVGTPAYAAPERLRGDSRPDPRMDVYSIGVVLFEMLVGVRPFDAPTFQELAQKVRKEPPPSLRGFRPDLPVELEHVILRALSKNREDRWSTAAEFAAALVPFGGRNIELDSDEPSDSFTMDLVKIRARETQRQRTLRPEDVERQVAKAAHQAPAAASISVPPVARPEPLSSVDIVVSLEDDLHSTDSRHGGREHAAKRERRREPHPPGPVAEAANTGPATMPSPPSFPELVTTGDLSADERVVSGKLVLAIMRFVATRFSERALKRVLDGLPHDVRPLFIRGIAADDWVSSGALTHLEQQVDAQLGRDDLHLVAQCGRAAADAAEDMLRVIAPKAIPPELLLAELPAVVSSLMKGLELKVRGVGRGYARIELIDSDPGCLTTCVSMLGFIDGSLGHCTVKEVEVNLVSSTALGDEETAYELSWVI
jgi:serine/threonine-protein kinase